MENIKRLEYKVSAEKERQNEIYEKIAVLLALAITVNGAAFINPTSASAAKKVALSAKKLTVKVGQSKKLKLKNNKKKVKWTVISGKKNITLKGKKKTGVTVVGRKKGSAKVQAKVGKKKYTCTVTVKAKKATKVTKTPSPAASGKPTKAPTKTPTPTNTPEPSTIYYNDENKWEVKKQLEESNISVHVIVEEGVTSIGGEAFMWCDSLTSITIPSSVTSIGAGVSVDTVFVDCGNLTSIKWNGNTYTSVDAFLNAFNNR